MITGVERQLKISSSARSDLMWDKKRQMSKIKPKHVPKKLEPIDQSSLSKGMRHQSSVDTLN